MSEPTHWAYLIALSIKLLAKFGLIPGFFAAFGIQKLRQKYRQRRAEEGWPSTVANIQWCKVHQEGMRNYWVEVTYSYFVANTVVATELFLVFKSVWVLAVALLIHAAGVLLCLKEPRVFDLWLARVSKCPRVKNHAVWGCNSYRP